MRVIAVLPGRFGAAWFTVMSAMLRGCPRRYLSYLADSAAL